METLTPKTDPDYRISVDQMYAHAYCRIWEIVDDKKLIAVDPVEVTISKAELHEYRDQYVSYLVNDKYVIGITTATDLVSNIRQLS